MATDAPLDYFESDQVRHAVALWRLVKKARGVDFDVLKFGRDWDYAEMIIVQCLTSQGEGVADAALVLLELRMRLVQEQPARAQSLGAVLEASPAQMPLATATVTTRTNPPGPTKESDTKASSVAPAAGIPKYVKSLR